VALIPGPFPTTPIRDDFNRADTALDVSTNWAANVRDDGAASPVIVTQSVRAPSIPSSAYWTGLFAGNDLEAYCTCLTANPEFELWARVAHPDDSLQVTAYVLFADGAGSVLLQRYGPGGTGWWVTLATFPRAIAAGDRIGLRVWGTTVEAWHSPAATGVWALVGQTTDATFPTGSQVAFLLYDTSDRLDNFGGGAVVYVSDEPTTGGSDLWKPWPGCETVRFASPSGDSITFLMLAGASGRMMPPAKVATLPVPAANGSRFLGAQHLERIVSLPVAFPGSLTDRDELRRWARVLDPTRGEGTLTVVDGAWAGRQLRCAYDAGLDTLDEVRPNVNLGTLLFRAAWPYWQDASEQSVQVTQGTTLTRWFPFLPLVLGASSAFAEFTVTNSGDADAFPVVEIRGPGTNPVVANLTTGQDFTVNATLAIGDLLTIDTRPGAKTVVLNGANAFPSLTVDSQLWPLVPGANRVSVGMSGTDATNSVATFTWRQSWLAA